MQTIKEKMENVPVDLKVKRLSRRLVREKAARKELERLLEIKSHDFYELTVNISQLIAQFEHQKKKLETSLNNEKNINELQRSVISMSSHEFRTPLTIIDSLAQRIHRRGSQLDEEKLQDITTKIRGSVSRMMTIMDTTLSAAKMEFGQLEIKPVQVNLRKILIDCCANQMLVSSTHDFVQDFQELPENIYADPSALNQIFTNLLSNAVKYSPQSDKIELKGWQDGAQIYVSIRDFGLGIDEEDIPQLFTRFFRAKTAHGIEGTGIGLHLIKLLIEEHGGTISIESIKGEGSMFTVCLPQNLPTNTGDVMLFK